MTPEPRPSSDRYYQSFFQPDELALAERFIESGYVIVPVEDRSLLENIRNTIAELTAEYLKLKKPADADSFLNEIGSQTSLEKLNEMRLFVYHNLNSKPWARSSYFSLARRTLEILVGNELVMQKRINLSIQLPNDDSSLLPIHSDCWSGDSPFEAVLWLPLVDCYKTKSMFLLPPKKDVEFTKKFKEFASKSAEDLYKAIEPHLLWLEVPFGHALVFTHTLMHGNRINREPHTRWSMNCRFKSVFSPYWDKRLGEFFEPITIRALTRIGMEYGLPTGFQE